MKLNLGAGKKPMPTEEGWVNIDLFVVGPGYVNTDVTDLRMFDDDSCDQLRLFHVIEHLDPYIEVPLALKEWLRVLKPGGFIEIECPDLLRCCINILQMFTSGSEDLVNTFGLQGLYGDTRQGPGMGHKWAWAPQTIRKALLDAGFARVIFENPISKPWQPTPTIRDLRAVAFKAVANPVESPKWALPTSGLAKADKSFDCIPCA